MKATNKSTENREAIPYYRTSTDDQLLGIDAQHETVLRIAGQKGLKVARDWTEHESGGNNDRPALDQALRYAKRTGATIIVAKLDRLARDSQFLMKLYDGNVPIIFGDLPEVDGSAAGRLMIQMMANFSEFERRRIGERTKEALAILKGRGVKLGASRPECQNLTDADRKRGSEVAAKTRTAQAIEEMADVAEIAVKMRGEGGTLQSIADHLNAERIPSRKGAAWNPMMVKRVVDRANAVKTS
jgi:DNA invertase Pin-like site-specific DNA recombinase